MKKALDTLNWSLEKTERFKESTLLKLDCKKALDTLNWKSSMDFKKSINFTSQWYLEYLNNNKIKTLSENQILEFSDLIKGKK